MTSVIDVLNGSFIPEVYEKSEPLLTPLQKVLGFAIICLLLLILFTSKFWDKTLLRLSSFKFK